MPVLVVVVSAVVSFFAIVLGFIFLRWKLGFQNSIKGRSSAPNKALSSADKMPRDVNQSGDSKALWASAETKIYSSERTKTTDSDDFESEDNRRDPVEFCGHIQHEIKKTKQRVAMEKIGSGLTQEQRELEREIQRQQLDEIFHMMEEQKDKFGMSSVDDVHQQMSLYIQ